MRHDPKAFGRRALSATNDNNAAGWQLRAIAKRRRDARLAAILAGLAALCFAGATAIAMRVGMTGGAAVFCVATFAAVMVGIVAASEA